MHSLINLLVWALLLMSAIGAGYVIYRALKLPLSPRIDTLLISAAVGISLFIYGTAALGFLHLLQAPLILGWVILVSVLALWGYWQLRHIPIRFEVCLEPKSVLSVYPIWGIKLALAGFFIVYLLAALAPPMNGDDLHSYLDIPRQYLDAGGIIPLPYELLSNLPMNIQMLSTTALAIRGDELALMLVSFTMVAGCALVIFALGRRYLNPEIGMLGALIFVSMKVISFLVPSAKVNLGFAFYDLLAVYCISRWAFDFTRNNRWLIVGGILSGIAFGTHYSAGITSFVLASLIAYTSWNDGLKKLAKRLISYGVPVILLASPWLVKNYLYTGNPVEPFMNPLFARPSLELIAHTKSIPGLVTILWDMSTDRIAYFGKPVGPLLFLILPGLLLLRPIPRKVRAALLFFIPLYLLWYIGVQRPRNLLTGLGILSLVSAYAYVELGRRSRLLRFGFIVLITVFLLFNLAGYSCGYFVTCNYQRYILGLESRSEFIKRLLDRYTSYPNASMTGYMNEQLPPDARILAVDSGNGYYIQRSYIDSRMVDGDFSHETAGDEKTLLDQWHRAGITHVFFNKIPGIINSKEFTVSKIKDPAFRDKYVEEVFANQEQHLYIIRYEE